MSKLKLTDINKTYRNGETVHALKGISLEFRENEFVAVLGPSGCGKTTLLNVIGGLDRYDSGDLTLGGMSTKKFRDSDWDAYRNRSIGFVFQNYNLIGHQTVLQNVEIAMTLSGVSAAERKRRAKDALTSVGLGDQIKKKPGQLSGGQMQRVAIARALVNNPDIILADEPTGALDSHTSVQVLEILKEISKEKLVIMVTHNTELADTYSSRVIHLLDGEVQSDSNPLFKDDPQERQSEPEENGGKKEKLKKTSMSLSTAVSLSFKNLMSKKWRTAITSFAGSIGIIGVALVLALSTGMSAYMGQMQSDTLSGLPISISEATQSVNRMEDFQNGNSLLGGTSDEGKFPEDNIILSYDSGANTVQHKNILTQDYFDYISKIKSELPDEVSAVSYTKNIEINLLAKGGDTVVKYATKASQSGMGDIEESFTGSSLYWQEMPDSEEFITSLYDLLGDGSRLPKEKNEVAIVVDEYNRLDKDFLEKLGIYTETESYDINDFIGMTILKVIPNDSFYTKTEEGLFVSATASEYGDLYDNADGLTLTITGVLRIKESASSIIGYLSEGLVYTTALTDYVVDNAQKSEIALAQKDSDTDILLNTPFANGDAKKERLLSLGAETTPTGISIYPKNFEAKDAIKEYLDAYNIGRAEEEQVVYSDISTTLSSSIGTMINTVSYVLIGFAAISLLVSTIMIGIITYVSVLERTKEIGILRSVGARKRDITMMFNAETLIIGFAAGALGIALSYLLTLPVNAIIANLTGIAGIAQMTVSYSLLLVAGSMILTLIAGFIPSKGAAKKDPVVALRTE